MQQDTVRAWQERIVIPTYGVGTPQKNPLFLEKRVYQGSSGVVYPHPVIERILDERTNREYTALFLENRYLKIMILPELGGRVQMALDKTNDYHFVYYNRVIKPALVGLCGPWISGGIEFNWPQHHRPSTFDPLDWRIEEHADGSRTVWCSEIERMFRTRGTHGFRLHPGRAYLEVLVRLYNRTEVPQSFLWWANPAVHVNDDYQSVFPPDVHAVMDHGKRDVSDFPIATGTYYKVNYAPGTDISRYRNIPVPTSFMAYHSDFDFIGCYDHGRRAGMMHVANHHVVPGKKQWTWGNGDFGRTWDRQLTDEDGPYIELMCGAYTDNQPDFSWIMPGEEKTFTQIFMPYKLIGPAKNASRDVVLNLELEGGSARLGVYASRPMRAQVQLVARGAPLFDRSVELTPESAFVESLPVDPKTRPQELTIRVLEQGRELLAFTPLPEERPPIPAPATPAPAPQTIASNEELFLNGLHLEQYRHATYAPEPYYEEALRRDPLDSRCNNAMGLLLYRRGRFAEAEPFFRRAVESLTRRNPNPYDGEPYYNLGLALRMQGRYAEAGDAFYKAIWNSAWQEAGYFELARLASRSGRFEEALELVERALERNIRHHKARHLKVALLRCLGRQQEAVNEARQSLRLDGFNYGALLESHRLAGQVAPSDPRNVHWRIEISLDYAHAGLYDEAIELLRSAPSGEPMALYFAGWFHLLRGEQDRAASAFAEASRLPPDFCFPNCLESVPALEAAMRLNPADARAPYYLGNFWYGHRRPEEAIACWEAACQLDESFPTAHRNLALAFCNERGDLERGLALLERAFAFDSDDARVFYELDQLHRKLNWPPERRLDVLEKHPELVQQRDDLVLERITLLNLLARHDEALQLLLARTFHPWEGGEGKVAGQYVLSLVEIARRHLAAGRHPEALDCLQRARTYPPNLGEGKLPNIHENQVQYWLGQTYCGLGDSHAAAASFQRAAAGDAEPASPMYYNDQPPEALFYRGLALREVGHGHDAELIFQGLVAHGRRHLDDEVNVDYFAVSLPDFLLFDEDLSIRNRIHCLYLLGLGHLGLGDHQGAMEEFSRVLQMDASHSGATLHRRMAAAQA